MGNVSGISHQQLSRTRNFEPFPIDKLIQKERRFFNDTVLLKKVIHQPNEMETPLKAN